MAKYILTEAEFCEYWDSYGKQIHEAHATRNVAGCNCSEAIPDNDQMYLGMIKINVNCPFHQAAIIHGMAELLEFKRGQ